MVPKFIKARIQQKAKAHKKKATPKKRAAAARTQHFAKKLQKSKKGVFYSPVKKANNQPLRNLEQPSYPEVVKYTEAACEKLLKKEGVIPTKGEIKKDYWCPVCHHAATYSEEADMIRCTTKSCNRMFKHVSIAYTPFGPTMREKGAAWAYSELVRSSYAIGV